MVGRTVELLYFEACPNHEALERRLRALLRTSWPDAELRLVRVESEHDAHSMRFLGSPTVRVDGRDVEPGANGREDFGLKCRIYRSGDALTGAPPDAWILDALTGGSAGLDRLRRRSVVNRLDDLTPAARALHRRILLDFAAGRSPSVQAGTVSDALSELEQRDAIQRDPASGDVVVAYPFSARPTQHEIEFADDAARAYAMCAIDALGIPFMLDRAVRIASRDPGTGEPIELAVAPDAPLPDSPVVVRVRAVGDGPSCASLCPYVEFLSRRPASADETVLDLPAAVELARDVFGSLLRTT